MFFSFKAIFLCIFAFATLVTCIPKGGRHKASSAINGLGVPISNTDAKNVIANRYIVVYNNNATDDDVQIHQASVMTSLRKRSLEKRTLDGRVLSNQMDTFSMMGWRGMALEADDGMMLDIAESSMVRYVWMDIERRLLMRIG